MSSCLSGSGRSYGFDLDIVKPSSSSSTTTSARSFHSSSPSSTLSESSNSPPRTISIKKARAPRKRPNQMYDEAAALLSTIYPNIFSAKSLRSKPLSKKAAAAFDSFQEDPELLPPLPVIGDAAFLIRPPPPTTEQPAFRIKLKVASPFDTSSPSNESSLDSPCSPVFLLDDDDDFDAESILDEEVGGGIDSIMGNLAADSSGADCNDDEESGGRRVRINPYLRSLIGSRTGGRYDFGSRLRHDRSMQKALRRTDEGEWWRTPAVPVPMGEILPQFKQPLPQLPQPTLSSSEKKSKNKNKKKKKVEKNKAEDATTTTNAAAVSAPEEISKGGLGLKLSHEDVLKAWSGRSMFADGPDPPESSAVAMARLKDIDLSPDGGGVAVREASVLRYKEKRRSRLFSKKIRYQVRKANADRRPRMKASSGRFVRSPSLLQQAMEAESSQ